MPLRLQRKRTRGYRLPANAIYVGRPGPFGNPIRIGGWFKLGAPSSWPGAAWAWCQAMEGGEPGFTLIKTPEQAVDFYRRLVAKHPPANLASLRGKNLACWCGLCPVHEDGLPLGVKCEVCVPCHADVLIEIANG